MSDNVVADRVVVGVNHSENATPAVAWAANWAASQNVPLTLLTAVVPVNADPVAGAAVINDLFAQVQEDARALLERTRSQLSEQYPGLSVDVQVTDAPVASALTEASSAQALVVVGAPPRGVLGRIMSTADQVVTHARGPVVVVPLESTHAPKGPVLVGADGSAQGERALRVAFQMAQAAGTSLLAFYAWELDFGWATAPVAIEHDQVVSLLEQHRRELEGSVAAIAPDFPDVSVQTRIRRDQPGAALVDASQEASMVVVGSRGRGGFVGLLLGSTSRKVLHGAHCPVIVVRG